MNINKTVKFFFERIFLGAVFCACMGVFFLGAYCLYEYNSPEYQVQKVLVGDHGTIERALFSHDDNPQQSLLTLIQAEHEKISVAAFSLTNGIVAQELVKAKMRGVVVEVIADGQNSINEWSKVPFLKANNIPLWIYPSQQFNRETPEKYIRANKDLMRGADQEGDNAKIFPAQGIMHNKFMIFRRSLLNKSILWTGSYNFTRSANNRNQENIIVTDNGTMIKSYLEQFEKIKSRCIRLAVMS